MCINKHFVIGIFFLIPLIGPAQTPSVEKSVFSIQTGFLGIWLNNESRLSDKIALRSETGFDSGIFGGSFYDEIGFLMTPVFTLEPRWYYNLEKRHAAAKNIKKNSGNFFGIKTSFNPDWFTISNYDNVEIANQVSFIPKWGIRRVYGKGFNMEVGLGIGYRYYFFPGDGAGEVAADLHLRFGYTF